VAKFGIKLDWLYLGDQASLGLMPHALVVALEEADR
jgi:hypothetical protein